MINQASSFIYSNVILPTITSPSVVMGSRVLSAFPILEIAYRAIRDLVDSTEKITYENVTPEEKTELENKAKQKRIKHLTDFAEHGLVSLFLGLAAANLFTGSAVLGTAF